MFRSLAEPVLTYGSEVWGPNFLGSLEDALTAPLQVLQNDYIRHLGGLRRSVPALILSAESCLPPLARAWLRASARHWDRMQKAPPGSLLRAAMAGDLALAHSLPRAKVHRTWSGAWLRTLTWLSQGGDAASDFVGDCLRSVVAAQADAAALQTLRRPLAHWPLAAWDGAVGQRFASARANALAAYRDSFALGPKELPKERGFPPQMPTYFRHTSSFRHQDHVRALMRVRCCSTPFAACPTLHTGAPSVCPHCPSRAAESAAHALLDCPAYADLRASSPFSTLFPTPPPAPALAPVRLHAFIRSPDQYTLSAFVHACFERRAHLLSHPEPP